MEILRHGSEGTGVRRWQEFLTGSGFLAGPVDGVFGPQTHEATVKFQHKAGLKADGIVGPQTYGVALQRGFDVGFSDPTGGTSGIDWPPKPSFRPLISNGERAEIFGRFEYEAKGPNDDGIKILGGWNRENIKRVTIPQLAGLKGAPKNGRIYMHRHVADQTAELFDAWERHGLIGLVKTWQGSFVPRFVRGSRQTLSNHAWGTAFDINYSWNKLGHVPAARGEPGSVRELVPIANDYGFYWGGHFSRRDGMHFEVARVIN